MTTDINYAALPKHLKLSYGWLKPRRDGTIGPTEQFSSTQFDKFITCPRAWAFSYICGIKESFMSPAAALGDRIHKQLDGVYDGKPLELNSVDPDVRFAAERAVPALQFIPRRDQVIDLYRERTDWLDTRPIAPDIEPLKIQIKQDLAYSAALAPSHKQWYCTDYKSVKTFDYMLTDSSLRANVQGTLYPADTMIRYQTPTVRGRWIYIVTDPETLPEARPLDAEFEYSETLRRAKPIIQIFDYMRHLVRLRVHPNSLPPNPEVCLLYYSKKKGTGGCQYRPEIFGPCDYTGPKVPRFEKPDPEIQTSLILAMTQPAAPVLQPLPPGWEWFHDVANNQYVPRQVTAAAPPPPPPVAVAVAPAISMPAGVPFAPPEAASFPVSQAAPPAPPAVVAPVAPVAPAVQQPAVGQQAAEPAKRKRRTKAEMELARALEASATAPVHVDPLPSVPLAPTVAPVSAPAAPPLASNGRELDEAFSVYGEVVSVKYARGGFVFEVPVSPADAGPITKIVLDLMGKALTAIKGE